MKIKEILKSAIPFTVGALIGAGLTKNKYVLYIIIGYFIFMILMRLFASKVTSIKQSTDKKLAVRNETVSTINDAIETTEKGNIIGASIFDRHYPNYVLIINMLLIVAIIWLAIVGQWMYVLICFAMLNFYVILNQIWRKVKDGY